MLPVHGTQQGCGSVDTGGQLGTVTGQDAAPRPGQQGQGRSWTYRAELAGADEDPALVQHASIQVEHVVDIYSHKVLRQVPLPGRSTRGEGWGTSEDTSPGVSSGTVAVSSGRA